MCNWFEHRMMKGFVVFVLLTVSLSYLLYKPMPTDVEQRLAVGIFISVIDSAVKFCFFLDRWGLGKWSNHMRTAVDAMAYVTTKHPPEGMIITDAVFDNVPVRIYRPPVADVKGEMTGAIVFYHGGGFVWGSILSYEGQTMAFATRSGVPVISVGYRRAPESPYPIPLDDCVAATVYFMHHAKDFNVDHNRIVIMGDSAGGNLAAASNMRLTQLLSLPAKPLAQVLIYPTLQIFDCQLPSFQQNSGKVFLSTEEIVLHLLTYMGETEDLVGPMVANNHTTAAMKADFAHVFDVQLLPDRYRPKNYRKWTGDGQPEVVERVRKFILDPFFSPLMASPELVRGLPETYIVTGGHDPLRDDGLLYAKKLESEGIRVQLVDYPTAYHPFFYQFEGPFATELAARAFDEVVRYLRTKLSSK